MARDWNLQAIPIKVRLRVFFSAVVVLMLLGSLLSFWQFRSVSGHAIRVSRAEQRITSLLRLNNNLITLMSQLHRAAEDQQAGRFEEDTHRLLDAFQRHTAEVSTDLQEIAKENDRYAVLVGSIQSMLDNLPARVSSFVQLAKNGDWVALHARLFNQADHTDDVVAALVDRAEADLAGARRRLSADFDRAQRSAVKVLALTAVLSLIAAALLGALITRSITLPLSHLAAGTRALAAGQFDHRVPVKGNDELANLTLVFNRTAGELAQLFEEVARERAIAEAAKSDLQNRAQELARANADLQLFAYSASHDLQEPLRTVALYSQLLHKQYAARMDDRAGEYMGYLLRGATHMRQLIADLLTYTQASTDFDEPESSTDVNALLARVLFTLDVSIQSYPCRVTAGPLPTVKVRETHVQQLLQNLIGNAMKYRSGDRDPEIHISAAPQKDRWLFSVRDNGIGINPNYATQIFGPFKRLHGQDYPGTGLGLAICQRIVELYGGTIWVESRLDEGSTFLFTLPAE
jgi:signal transduction histidine kinase